MERAPSQPENHSPECTAESADKPRKLLHLPAGSPCPPAKATAAAAAEAETGGNLKGHAGKTAGNEAYSESALSTRKLLHLPGCPAESADISKPTAEKASTAQWSKTERTPVKLYSLNVNFSCGQDVSPRSQWFRSTQNFYK